MALGITITPAGVRGGDPQDFTIEYKAVTAVDKAYLVIELPKTALVGSDGLATTPIVLQKDNSSNPYYVSDANLGDAKQVLVNEDTTAQDCLGSSKAFKRKHVPQNHTEDDG